MAQSKKIIKLIGGNNGKIRIYSGETECSPGIC